MAGHWRQWGNIKAHFQYVFIYMLGLRTLTHCDESGLLLTLVLLHFKAAVFYKIEFLIKTSRFRVINCLCFCVRLLACFRARVGSPLAWLGPEIIVGHQTL